MFKPGRMLAQKVKCPDGNRGRERGSLGKWTGLLGNWARSQEFWGALQEEVFSLWVPWTLPECWGWTLVPDEHSDLALMPQ